MLTFFLSYFQINMASPVLSPGHLPTTSNRREPEPSGRSSHQHHTKFQPNGAKQEDYRQQRSKILTVKYGKQQMILIRKRVSVEMWLMESLEELYEGNSVSFPVSLHSFLSLSASITSPFFFLMDTVNLHPIYLKRLPSNMILFYTLVNNHQRQKEVKIAPVEPAPNNNRLSSFYSVLGTE